MKYNNFFRKKGTLPIIVQISVKILQTLHINCPIWQYYITYFNYWAVHSGRKNYILLIANKRNEKNKVHFTHLIFKGMVYHVPVVNWLGIVYHIFVVN